MNCLVQGTYKQCSFHEAEADAGSEPGDDGDSDAGERPVKRSSRVLEIISLCSFLTFCRDRYQLDLQILTG